MEVTHLFPLLFFSNPYYEKIYGPSKMAILKFQVSNSCNLKLAS